MPTDYIIEKRCTQNHVIIIAVQLKLCKYKITTFSNK